MSKEQKKREDGFEHLEEALTSGEQFIEKNQKMKYNRQYGFSSPFLNMDFDYTMEEIHARIIYC